MDSESVSASRRLQQRNNEWASVYFTVAILGPLAVFTVLYWATFASKKSFFKADRPIIKKTLELTRKLRGLLLLKVPLFTSTSRIIILFIYLAINLTLCLYNLDWSSLYGFGKRLGWIATCNIALVTFLALRNTPLGFLIGCSHERLKYAHQVAGYFTVIFSLLHAIVFTIALSRSDDLESLLEDANIVGIVAGLSMLLILGSALIFRRQLYEAFYIIHITLFLLIIITVGMHRPEITLKALIIIIFTASIWVADRIIRFAKIAWHTFGNNASIVPLTRDSMRIILRKSSHLAIPGQHVFLWIPKIRSLETHPFTIVSTNPLELVVSTYDGFTKDLFSYASKNPGAILRASIDGPYGTLPDFSTFDRVILIAGGSGASFTFGIANHLIKNLGHSATKPIIYFIWAIREQETLTQYAFLLSTLNASPLAELIIHITRPTSSPSIPFIDGEKLHLSASMSSTAPHPKRSQKPSLGCDLDSEKGIHVHVDTASSISTSPTPAHEVHTGRPDIGMLIPAILERDVASTRGYGRTRTGMKTIIAACGPKSLMLATRKTVGGLLREGQNDIELHCESFGW